MNPFQLNFTERLQAWNTLRDDLKNKSLAQQCIDVDEWWQRAPLVNHYLHIQDTQNWPDPWQLIAENEYCLVARGLGMWYTMHLLGVNDIQLLDATDEYGDDVIIISCDKYAMNWHPNTILNTHLTQFSIKRKIDISHLLIKIR